MAESDVLPPVEVTWQRLGRAVIRPLKVCAFVMVAGSPLAFLASLPAPSPDELRLGASITKEMTTGMGPGPSLLEPMIIVMVGVVVISTLQRAGRTH